MFKKQSIVQAKRDVCKRARKTDRWIGQILDFVFRLPSKARAAIRIGLYEVRLMIRISCLSFRRCDWNLKADAQRVVLLAWLFPPIISGGTYRPATLAKTGWEKGWRFAVFAGPAPEPSNEAGTVLLRKLPVSAEIHRTSSDRANARSLFFPRMDGGTFRLVFETVLNIIGALDRIRPALVMATGPPFHNFVVATLVARYFRCALVLEYRDEWTECPFHFVRPGPFDRRMERWCLRSAARVILTTESQRVHLLKVLPEISPSDCVVIPNGYDADDLPSMPFNCSKAREGIDPFVLSYLGFLGDHTPPDSFLQTVTAVVNKDPNMHKRLRIEFVGTRSNAARRTLEGFPLPGIVIQRDLVPKHVAIQCMANAGALLLLNPRPLHRYLPGKLYDYIASGTPILVYGAGGEVGRLIAELGVGIVVPENDPEALRAALQALKRRPFDNNANLKKWLAERTRAYLSEATLRLFEQVVESASP